MARQFRRLGTGWGVLRNLADTPLFIDSRASRVVQLADHVSYAVFRRYEQYQEHAPPHFHAEHQGQQGTFDFSGQPLAGNLKSGTAVRLIREWAAAHRSQLEANWANMEAGRSLERIEPLE